MSESGQHRFESRVPLSLRHSSLYPIEYKQKKAKKYLSKTLKDLKKAKRTKKKILKKFKASHINLRNSICLCPLQAGPVRHPARLQRLDTNSNSSGSMEENNKIH